MDFRIRLEQRNRQFCHAKGGTKTKCRKYWAWFKSMHLDIKVRAGVMGGSSRTRPLADWQPCMDPAWHTNAHTTTRDSKPQLWTGHTSPRFRNNPYHATTARPLSQDPSTLHDAAAARARHPVPRLGKVFCSGLSRCRRARPLGLTGSMVSFCFVPQPRL